MKSHRGLSSVVGAVFLIAILIGGLSYISGSMEIVGNFSESLITEESRLKDKQNEAFEITSIDITPANKLDGVIKNTGQIPVKLTTLWIDEQGVNDVVQKFTLDKAIAPGNTVNIIDLADYTIDPTKGYNMKVVTSRGEVNSFYVNSPSQENLLMQIKAVPEFVPTEFTTTILYSIVNNMSNSNILYNVTPQLTITDIVGTDVGSLRSGPIPPSYPSLAPGDVAVFEYSIQMIGDANDSAFFNATIANGMVGNSITTTAFVQDITLATQAGTSLISSGLATESGSFIDILFFHDESNLTPNGEYQMGGSDPAGPGTTLNPRDGDITFMTANVTSITDIVNGTWNMRLSYWSELSPNGVPDPDMAWHFECNNCGGSDDTSESTGNISTDDFDKNGSVSWFSTGGPDNDGYYKLGTLDDYLQAEWNAYNEYTSIRLERDEPASTAVWFRIPATTDNYFPLVRWGDDNDWDECSWNEDRNCDDEYEIALGDGDSTSHGNIIFQYKTNNESEQTKCETDGSYDYDDGQWHLAVGTRSDSADCKLYIDGYLADDVEECNGCSATNRLDFDNTFDIFLGYDGNSNECENCEFGSFMHWANTVLDAGDVEELYYTNFGDNGTRLDWSVYRTNGVGVNQETIFTGTSEMPFADPAVHSTSSSRYDSLTSDSTYNKHSFYNATFTIPIGNVTLAVGERITAVLSWPGDNQNLEMNIRIDDDDNAYILPDETSYIQSPPAYPALPTFTIIDNDDNLVYTVFNNGPEGAWFTYGGTRFVVTLLDGSESYAGIIDKINGTLVSADQDSIFIPNQQAAELEFEILSNPPQLNAPAQYRAPPGTYNAAVFLSGFDDMGETFLRTITIGVAQIVE